MDSLKILKRLKGHSTSKIFLIEINGIKAVRKINNIQRNLERISELSKLQLNIPKIYTIGNNYYDMEYINNINISQYLINNSENNIIEFLKNVVTILSKTSCNKNYLTTFQNKLNLIDFSLLGLNFSASDLLQKLPKNLPQSCYHGDLTFDNILFNIKENNFTLIDPLTTEYDSYIFDLIKLRQDLYSKWFIRKSNLHLDAKLKIIDSFLKQYEHYDNIYLLILMLLRIIPYANLEDKKFLIQEINTLWK